MKDISHLYGEKPGSLFEGYYDLELERIADIGDDKHFEIMTVAERRCIRYYFQHRRGETAFSASWADHIESAIAKILAFEKEKLNKRLVIFDQHTQHYWAGTGISQEPWCKTKAKALIFSREWLDWLEEVCDRSTRSTGHNGRFIIMEIDATKRLERCKF